MGISMSSDPGSSAPDLGAKLDASIRKVMRAFGIPESETEDLCQHVRLAVHTSPRVPTEEPERTHYIHGIARNVARKHRGELAADAVAVPMDDVEDLPGEAPPLEAIDLARKLHAEAVAHDPQGADWLVRAKVYGDTEVGIASHDGVPVDRVRKRIARLVTTMRSHPVALAAIAGVVLVTFYLNRGTWRDRRVVSHGRPDEPTDVGKSTDARHPTLNEQEAAAMRTAALRACDARKWKACLAGLDMARSIDPSSDAREEVRAARSVAESEVIRDARADAGSQER